MIRCSLSSFFSYGVWWACTRFGSLLWYLGSSWCPGLSGLFGLPRLSGSFGTLRTTHWAIINFCGWSRCGIGGWVLRGSSTSARRCSLYCILVCLLRDIFGRDLCSFAFISCQAMLKPVFLSLQRFCAVKCKYNYEMLCHFTDHTFKPPADATTLTLIQSAV